MTAAKKLDTVDMNRDPITGTAGSHPVGTGVGSAGLATAGAITGTMFGPIGFLVGGVIGAVAGAAIGHTAAEAIDPTGENEYWRNTYKDRPYAAPTRNYETDYQPAYTFGTEQRNTLRDRQWDDSLETDLKRNWDTARGTSALNWDEARPAIRDAWDRTDRTYKTYQTAENDYTSSFQNATYKDANASYGDYQPAYRYGTYARAQNPTRQWDDSLESDLARGWDKAKGQSKLGWEKAKAATKDAWHRAERLMPGDADNDGR